MIIPAAMFIESAQDMLKDGSVPDDVRAAQLKEFTFAAPSASADMQKGYELGLQVARVLLMGNMAAIQAGVNI
jgi:hypothetical protein